MEHLCQFDLQYLAKTAWLCGVDEAGRGALAGPVAAGAVFAGTAFFEVAFNSAEWASANDSKKLTLRQREQLFQHIQHAAEKGLLFWASGEATVQEIAQLNILGATRLAMQKAIEGACPPALKLPEAGVVEDLFNPSLSAEATLLIDGKPLKPFPYAHQGVINGDGQSLLIALASVVAKVTRDRCMVQLAREHTQFGFEVHKGYATKTHRAAILEHGTCPAHRSLFLRKLLAQVAS